LNNTIEERDKAIIDKKQKQIELSLLQQQLEEQNDRMTTLQQSLQAILSERDALKEDKSKIESQLMKLQVDQYVNMCRSIENPTPSVQKKGRKRREFK